MSLFETTAITVPYRRRCEDRTKVITFDDGVVIVVADGAGGSGAGEEAAETVIREVSSAVHSAKTARCSESFLCEVLQRVDRQIGDGESTCVVVSCTVQGLAGATVGDSQAWFISNGEIADLSRHRQRKPLLGTGEARPVGFSHPTSRGLLLVATDGFCNYIQRERLLQAIPRIDFLSMGRMLVDMARLPSGELWDDIAIVACRPQPKPTQRRRYELTDPV